VLLLAIFTCSEIPFPVARCERGLAATSRPVKQRITTRRTLLRATALYAILGATARPRQPLVTFGQQQQVITCNPKIGVHTRLTDEVEEWKIKRTLQMVREMGAPWIVEYFPWAYCEPQRGRFSWEHSDLVVAHAVRQGLQIIARLGYPPKWAQPPDSPATLLLPDSFSDFAHFCARFARRYADSVSHVIIWNEPNLAMEWGFRQPSAEEYVQLLRECYNRIKETNPGAIILAGALAPTPSPLEDPLAVDDLTFLQALYTSGATEFFDALAIHSYGWATPPEDDPEPNRVNFRRAELLRQIMVTHGDTDKPCFITEAGWNDHPRWTRAVSPALRIQYTKRAYQYAQQRWPWCHAVAMWAFRFPWPQHSYQDYFAFVSPSFGPRPIYQAIREYSASCVT